jgi:hypothetical protein
MGILTTAYDMSGLAQGDTERETAQNSSAYELDIEEMQRLVLFGELAAMGPKPPIPTSGPEGLSGQIAQNSGIVRVNSGQSRGQGGSKKATASCGSRGESADDAGHGESDDREGCAHIIFRGK